jgi:hypothetical protein
MAVDFPENRKKTAPVRSAVLHLVAKPDFIISRIPDPGSSLRIDRCAINKNAQKQ